jgi:hypothetical protein
MKHFAARPSQTEMAGAVSMLRIDLSFLRANGEYARIIFTRARSAHRAAALTRDGQARDSSPLG